MERSGRYVACLVLGMAFAMAMSRPAPTPVMAWAGGFASRFAAVDTLRHRAGFEADGCPALHSRDAGSDAAEDVG